MTNNDLIRNWRKYHIVSNFLPVIALSEKFEKCLGIRHTQYGPGVAFLVCRMREEFPGSVSILILHADGQCSDAAFGNMMLGHLVPTVTH